MSQTQLRMMEYQRAVRVRYGLMLLMQKIIIQKNHIREPLAGILRIKNGKFQQRYQQIPMRNM